MRAMVLLSDPPMHAPYIEYCLSTNGKKLEFKYQTTCEGIGIYLDSSKLVYWEAILMVPIN
jgi:hypothetical protein